MKKVISRKWFNSPETEYTSFIMWSVDFPQKNSKEKYSDEYAYARLKIADCNKSIEFALDTEDKHIKGTMDKLQLFIDEITKLKETLRSAYDVQFEILKDKANKEKEKDARKNSKKVT